MTDEIVYMLGIVAVGFAVNYLLRALPFLFLARRNRALPKSVERLGAFISPVIIAGLVVYSYSGSAWRTPWPYLAGVVTVVLHVWRRNPLMSIIAGTAVYMLLLNCCGCSTTRTLELDAQHPAIAVTTEGFKFAGTFVKAEEIVDILEDYDVPHECVIHIRLEPDVRDLRPARLLMGCLSRAGYTRPVLVTARHAESIAIGKPASRRAAVSAPRPSAPRVIRYKGANE